MEDTLIFLPPPPFEKAFAEPGISAIDVLAGDSGVVSGHKETPAFGAVGRTLGLMSVGKVPSEPRPVFILGHPRSGTTLLGTMLSAHSSIAIAPETRFLDQGMALFAKPHKERPGNFEDFWADYSQREHFRSLGMNSEVIKERIVRSGNCDFKTTYSQILEEFGRQCGKTIWGDKSHIDHSFIPLLLEWFPKGKVVLILRDPRAVVASLQQVPWGTKYVHVNARQWVGAYRLLREHEQNNRTVTVTYESLVKAPEEELRRVCLFLEVDYESAMVSRPVDPTPTIELKEWSANQWWHEHRKAALRRVSTDSIDKWRSQLTTYHISVVEHIGRREMMECGYEPVTSGLGLTNGLHWGFEVLGCHVLYNLRRGFRAIRHPMAICPKLTRQSRRAKSLLRWQP